MALLVLFRFLDEVLPDEEVALHTHRKAHQPVGGKHDVKPLYVCSLHMLTQKALVVTSRAVSNDWQLAVVIQCQNHYLDLLST